MPAAFVVEPLANFRRAIADAVDLSIANGWITPIPAIIVDVNTVTLGADQTPPKNQLDRGTCWAFAGIAALEAAYRRKFGLVLDLSEQYLFHICKAHESDFGNHSLMGFQGSSDIVKHLERMRVPTEAEAPYLSNAAMIASIPAAQLLSTTASPTQEQRDAFEFDPRHIPIAARANCRYGVKSAGVLTNFSISDLEQVIANRHEVVVNVTVGGGGHVLVLYGYNKVDRFFLAKNSWAGSGFIQIRYENDPTFTIDTDIAHYIIDVVDPAVDVRAGWVGDWNTDHDGWLGRAVFRRFTDLRAGGETYSPQGATKLGSYYLNNQKYDMVGHFEHGGRTAHVHIPGLGGDGQDFQLHLYSNDIAMAAGQTSWSGIPFGTRLKRTPLSAAPPKEFETVDWLGVWEMNHDGWRGVLTLDGIAPVAASYKRSTGEQLAVGGTLNPTHPHALDLNINFGPDNPAQPFRLLYHTREKGVFSGSTSWAGISFGVQATKQSDKPAWRGFEVSGPGSAAPRTSMAAVSRIPNSMEVWWIGPEGSVEVAYWYDGGQWTRYQLAPPGSASPSGGIAALSRIPSSLEVWWIGRDGSIEASFWYEGGQPTRYQLAPPGSADPNGGIAAVSRIPGSMELWWPGASGSLEAAYWYDGGNWGRYQLAPDGSVGAGARIAAVSRIPGSMELWWTTPDGAVDAAFWYDGGNWGRYRLADPGSAAPAAGIAALSRIPNSMEVWWVGRNGAIEVGYWYDGGQWGRYQLAPDGSAAPGTAIAAVSRIPTSMELWWAGTDGSVQGSFWYEGGQPTRYRLEVPGLAAQPFAAAAVSRAPKTMELWWTGIGGTIRDAYYYDLM